MKRNIYFLLKMKNILHFLVFYPFFSVFHNILNIFIFPILCMISYSNGYISHQKGDYMGI